MKTIKNYNLFNKLPRISKCIMLLAAMTLGIKAYNQTPQGGIVGGSGVSATGQYSSAIGFQTVASGDISFAGGMQSQAQGEATLSFGVSAIAKNNYSIAMGWGASALSNSCVAIGQSVIAGTENNLAQYAVGIGNLVQATGTNSMALGQYVKATGTNSMAIGMGYSASQYMTNSMPKSVAIATGSTIPTLYIGASPNATGTGNVGIGTTIPSQKLEVQGNVFINDENSGLIMKSEDGTQWKIIINNDGQLEVVQAESIEDIKQVETIEISPNPANESIQLTLSEKEFPIQTKIYDIEGTIVNMQMFYQNNIKINIENLPQGNYILQIIDSKQQIKQSGRFIKL